VGDDDRRIEGLLLTANALLETGSPAFRPTLDAYLTALDDRGQPRHRYLALTRRAALALLEGRLEEAALLIDQSASLGDQIHEPDTGNVRMSQLLELTRARGDADEQRAFAAEAVRWWVGAPVYAHGVAAGFLARAGDLRGARRHVDIVIELGSWRAERSYLWSILIGNLATAAARLEDMHLCERIFDELSPLESSCGVNGAVVAFAGSHAHFAGVVAAALGRQEQAAGMLQEALRVHVRLGAAAWEAETRAALSALGLEEATSLGSIVEKPVKATLSRRDSGWEITFGSESMNVVDVKGIRDLALLLGRPGADIHVLELAGSAAAPGTSFEAVDRKAVAAYRQRLVELSEEREEAERNNDLERVARVDSEHQALVDELGRVTGLGGQPRQLGHHAGERARKAVSGRIRDAIRRIEGAMPGLAAHLDQYVVTGTYCRYRMDAGITWKVDW
ncbi:MAG: hypothetical protein H0U53_08235, partial [Actinobacteria bacterium]|nr:hypothetical protein [Actinomycetota bacterium]